LSSSYIFFICEDKDMKVLNVIKSKYFIFREFQVSNSYKEKNIKFYFITE